MKKVHLRDLSLPFQKRLATFCRCVKAKLGGRIYEAKQGETIYFQASEEHQILNAHDGITELIIVATESYL